MPDEDIMDQLKKIDEDEIVEKEISFDDDLDFEGLDDMDNSLADVGIVLPTAPAVAPPAPQVRTVTTDDIKPKKSSAKKTSAKKTVAKSTKEATHLAQVETSVTEIDEVVLRAKVLRIVADKVIIEPGNNVSFS